MTSNEYRRRQISKVGIEQAAGSRPSDVESYFDGEKVDLGQASAAELIDAGFPHINSPVIDEEFLTKAKACQFLASKGFTVETEVAESGDYGYGSRVYYRNPTTNDEASISKVADVWMVAI